jgi:hypothetical protein
VIDEIRRDWAAWESVSAAGVVQSSASGGDACLVLGTWGLNTTELPAALSTQSNVFYKAHPHYGARQHLEGAQLLLPSWVPAEVFLILLSRQFSSVTVLHQASSVEFNSKNQFPNVSFVDLSEKELAASLRLLISLA